MSINLRIERTTPQTVAVNANVLFNNVPLLDGSIDYDSATGVITINQAGTFIINWTVSSESTLSTSGTVFSIISSNGETIVNNNCRKTGEASGFGIINVPTPGVTVRLVNTSLDSIVLQPLVPIKASLMLFEEVPGATGPTGAIGPTGATGATGATGPSFTHALGFVYGPERNYTVASSEAIQNSAFYSRRLNVTFQDNGIVVSERGYYYVSYQVSVGPNQYGAFNIAANGITYREGFTQFATYDRTSVISGSGIIEILAGTLITIVNVSGRPIIIGDASSWSSSNMSLFRLY